MSETHSGSDHEIERKFLVLPEAVYSHLPRELESYVRQELEQGYLAIDEQAEVRLRKMRRRGHVQHLQTVKHGEGLVRREREAAVTPGFFALFWELTADRRVSKTRFEINDLFPGCHVFLDRYSERLAGLNVLEIEFASEQEARSFAAPPWLGREVTEDRRYGARRLASAAELPPFI